MHLITYFVFLQERKYLTTNSNSEIFDDYDSDEEDEERGQEEMDEVVSTNNDENDDEQEHDEARLDKLIVLDFEEEDAVLGSLEPSSPLGKATHAWKGYKMVGDNVDKNIRRSFQRVDRSTFSLHYFHSFAVLDRIDFSSLSDAPVAKTIHLKELLPTLSDISYLKNTFTILISRYVSLFFIMTINV